MQQTRRTIGTGRTDEFRKQAVRIALTSGLSRHKVADDLGGGFSTLNKWFSAHRGTDVVSAEDRDLARENERLRRAVRILKEEMRKNGIVVKRIHKFKAKTDSDHIFNISPNLLEHDFTADRPNQKWAGDISYIWTCEGWLYLAVILDLRSRRVIGWAVSDRMKRNLAIRALKMAIALRSPPPGCVFHSDRGSQYCSHDYQKILREHGL